MYILYYNVYIPEINSSHLKMDGWIISFLFGVASWQVRTVRFRECNVQIGHTVPGTKVLY